MHLTRTISCLLVGACAAHTPEATVARETSVIRCIVIGRGAAADGIGIGARRVRPERIDGGRIRPVRATFNFRNMSFKIDQLEGRIVRTAFLGDGRRTAQLSGPAAVTFPPPAGIGHIVYDEGSRIDEITCEG